MKGTPSSSINHHHPRPPRGGRRWIAYANIRFGTDVRDNYFNNIIAYMKETQISNLYTHASGEGARLCLLEHQRREALERERDLWLAPGFLEML